MSNFTKELVKRNINTDRRVRQLEAHQTPVRGGSEAIIASGAITASKAYHRLLPETGTSDTLATITPPFDSKFLLLRTLIPGHTITIQTGTGNLELSGGDCILDEPTDSLYVMWDDKLGAWIEVSRAPAGGGKQYATFVVAASDSTDADKANADYVCDGTADQVEINSALAATTPSTYQRVLLCAGTYNLSATVTMTTDSVLEGQGDPTVITSTSAIELITCSNDCTICNILFDDSADNTVAAVYATGKTKIELYGLTLLGFGSYGIRLIASTSHVNIHDCNFYAEGTPTYSVYGDASTHIRVTDCYFHESSEGIWLDGCDYSIVVGNSTLDCDTAIDVGGNYTVITGNIVRSEGLALSTGINVYSGKGVTISGNTVYSYDECIVANNLEHSLISANTCTGDPVAETNSFGIDVDTCFHCTITSNVCSDNGFGAGLYLIDSDYNLVVGNICVGNSYLTSAANAATNDTYGILIQRSDYNFVTGNKCKKSSVGSTYVQGYGIGLKTLAAYNLITNNDLRDGGQFADYIDPISGGGATYITPDGVTPQQTLTLSSDAVTVTGRGYYTILPQSGTADDMITINGGSDGMIIYLRAETASHVITVKETGNIALVNSQFRMVGREDLLTLIYDGDQSKWIELGRTITNTGYALTIASGVVTVQKAYHTLTPETGAVDDLTTINGGVDGQLLILQATATKTVTLKDGLGNLDLSGDFEMIDTDDKIIILTYNGTANIWVELYRSGTADIADGYVTFAKMQDITTDRLIGRDTAGAGPPTEISLGASLEFTGSNSIQRAALTGDVTASANSNALTIPNDTITNAKMANMAESTIKGRASGAGTGDPTDLTAAQVLTILGVNSALHAFSSFAANTAGGGDTTLDSYTVPAGKLAAAGDTLWFEAFGTFAANANSKTLKVHFGSSGVKEILNQPSTQSGVDWEIKGRVMRISSSAQKASVSLVINTTVIQTYTSGLNQDLTSTVTFSVIGASSGSGDIILEGFIVGYTAAP